MISLDLSPARPGARHRRAVSASRASRPACSAPTSSASSTPRAGRSATSRTRFTHSTLGGWIATRSSGMQSDRYGDIADLTRAVRVVTPAGRARHPPGAAHLDGPERARDGARQRGAARRHHRGDGARAPAARRARDPRLPVPDLGRGARRHARHRRERGGAVGHARVGRAARRRSRSPRARHPTPLDRVKSDGAARTFLQRRRKGFDLEAMCLSFIGYEGTRAPRRRRSASWSGGSSRATAACASAPARASCTTRRSSTRPTSATSCSTAARSPTSRRPSAPWSALPAVYDGVMAAARGAFDELGVRGYVMCHLSHSYHAGACLYFTFALQARRARDALERVRRGQVRDPAGVRRHGRDALPPPRGRHRARALAGGGHLRARRRDAAGAVRRRRSRARTSTRGRSRERRHVRGRRVRPPPAAGGRVPRALRACSGVLGPLMDLYTRRRVSGPRAPRGARGARAVRRQPLQPHGHAGDPARAAARAGGGAPRWPPPPTTSTRKRLARGRGVAGVQHRAGGRARARAPDAAAELVRPARGRLEPR